MANTPPPLVDKQGNIRPHRAEGVKVVVMPADDETFAGTDLYLRLNGAEIAMPVDPDESANRLIVITPVQVQAITEPSIPYAIVDKADPAFPIVRFGADVIPWGA